MLLGLLLTLEGFCCKKDILEALDAQAMGDKRRLGEILVTNGKITSEQLEMVLSIQRSEYKLLGQILIQEDYCNEEDILEALDTQATGDKRLLGEILLANSKIKPEQLERVLAIQRG